MNERQPPYDEPFEDSPQIWEGSSEERAQWRVEQRKMAGWFLDSTVRIASGAREGNEIFRKLFEANVARGGMMGETVQLAYDLLGQGKTPDETRTALDAFMKEHGELYKEVAERDFGQAVQDDMDSESPIGQRLLENLQDQADRTSNSN